MSLETVTFQKRTHSTLKTEIEVESLLDKTQLDKVSSFNFPVRVNRYNPLISDERKKKKQSVNKYGRVYSTLPIKVTPALFEQVCLFLEGITRLFKYFGWELTADKTDHGGKHKGAFVFNDEKLFFELKEPVKQVPYKKKECDSPYWTTSYNYLPTGVLEFRIENIYSSGLRGCWKDTKPQQLEQQALSIVKFFSRAFEYKRLQKIEKMEQRKNGKRVKLYEKKLLGLKRLKRKSKNIYLN